MQLEMQTFIEKNYKLFKNFFNRFSKHMQFIPF